MYHKQDNLRAYLRELGSVAISFSGGVDSTYLLKVAHDTLGDKAIAVTARSCSFPKRELKDATAFCASEGIRHIICDSDELSIEGFSDNPTNRCYLCKRELLGKIRDAARENGIAHIAEGSNVDDDGDYRPGFQAVVEQGVKSPLRHVGLTKEEIRQLSKEMGLSTWDKPSFACLVSRFPYGEKITMEKLSMIERAEQNLLDMGVRQVRVRFHSGSLARIEVDDEGFSLITSRSARLALHARFKEIGFAYVSLDLLGYRMGSMNERL